MKARLDGVKILVTRPSGQSAELVRLISAAGGEPVLFPALEIEALAAAAPALDHLAHFDLVVFVSPNAVRTGMPHILKKGGLPAEAKIAAMGPGTAAELKKFRVGDIILPRNGFDSEALIDELSILPLRSQHALIVRGQGGRELLGETLALQGARVDYLECYRRVKPDRDMRELMSRQVGEGKNACMATSANIVENLFEMAGAAGRAWLCAMPFFVSHPRVASAAFCRGVQAVFVAGSGDDALMAGMLTWFARVTP
ncbi:MAG: uroporphyrinogen-III synthase [Betaproteobacteria bacterium]|jgi:uroporphyrinogen-III synthase